MKKYTQLQKVVTPSGTYLLANGKLHHFINGLVLTGTVLDAQGRTTNSQISIQWDQVTQRIPLWYDNEGRLSETTEYEIWQ